MFRYMGGRASMCILVQRTEGVKGGPEENAPGLREVIRKEEKAHRYGSGSETSPGALQNRTSQMKLFTWIR